MVETGEATSATQEGTQAPATGEEEKKHDVEYADEGAQNAVSYLCISYVWDRSAK